MLKVTVTSVCVERGRVKKGQIRIAVILEESYLANRAAVEQAFNCLLISVHQIYQSSYQKKLPQIHIYLLWIGEKLFIGMNRPQSTTPNHFLQCRLRAQGLDVGPLIGQVPLPPLPMDLGLRHQSSHILMTITTANSTSQHLPDLWRRWTLWDDD